MAVYDRGRKVGGRLMTVFLLENAQERPRHGIAATRKYARIFEGPEEEWDPADRLVAAALYNDIEAAKKAIAAGADVASFRSGRASPLDAAIIGGSMELIPILLKNGARPTSKSRDAAKFVGRNEVIELIDRLERK